MELTLLEQVVNCRMLVPSLTVIVFKGNFYTKILTGVSLRLKPAIWDAVGSIRYAQCASPTQDYGNRLDGESLYTLMCEIEAIINSRSLTAISAEAYRTRLFSLSRIFAFFNGNASCCLLEAPLPLHFTKWPNK